MALHGEVKVNHQIIAYWSARRTTELNDHHTDYIYEVEYQTEKEHWTGWVTHKYSDGAAVLASKVLLEYAHSKVPSE